MAIARNSFQDYVMATGVGSENYSYTCGSGANRLLIFGIQQGQGTNTDVVSGVTYATIAMTRLGTISTTTTRGYLYALVAPASGANNITSSFSPTSIGGWTFAADYTGCDQTAVPANVATATNNATTTLATTITVANATSWVSGVASNNAAQIAVDKGILLANTQNVARANWDSNATVAAGSYTVTFSDGGVSAEMQALICEILATSSSKLLPLMGVGT